MTRTETVSFQGTRLCTARNKRGIKADYFAYSLGYRDLDRATDAVSSLYAEGVISESDDPTVVRYKTKDNESRYAVCILAV